MTDSPFTIELIPKIRHYITEEELTQIMEEESSSFNIFEFGRRLWVILQSCLIYWWIYKGFKYYRAVQNSFMRAQWVLTMQFGIVTYVLINEFVYKNIVGIFLLLAFAHYVNFLTFTLVVDSCQTKQMDQKLTKFQLC